MARCNIGDDADCCQVRIGAGDLHNFHRIETGTLEGDIQNDTTFNRHIQSVFGIVDAGERE
jgi:hypothetical protein